MSDAQTDGAFLTSREREDLKKKRQEGVRNLRMRNDFLISIQEYLLKPNPKTFRATFRNLRTQMSEGKASNLLKGLKEGSKRKWAWFLSKVPEDDWFVKFQRLSPFKDQIIAIGDIGFSTVEFKTNKAFEAYLCGKRQSSANDFLFVFDKNSKVRSIEIGF